MIHDIRKCLRSWWRLQLETFSTLLAIFAGNSPVTGEFPTQSPVTWSFDVFFDLRLHKRLSKQSWGWWFETKPSCPLWRHCDVVHAMWMYLSYFSMEVYVQYLSSLICTFSDDNAMPMMKWNMMKFFLYIRGMIYLHIWTNPTLFWRNSFVWKIGKHSNPIGNLANEARHCNLPHYPFWKQKQFQRKNVIAWPSHKATRVVIISLFGLRDRH